MTDDIPHSSAPDVYEMLKADIAAHGVRVPVKVDYSTGALLDGFHRTRAYRELVEEGHELPELPVEVVLLRVVQSDDGAVTYWRSLGTLPPTAGSWPWNLTDDELDTSPDPTSDPRWERVVWGP